jgi:hypothetical protein
MTVCVVVALASMPAAAARVSSELAVSTTVIGRAVVDARHPQTIEITECDIARGFVEIDAVSIAARTNSRSGYFLRFSLQSPGFSSATVLFDDATVRVASEESWIARPYVAGGDQLQARVRIDIGELAPGHYAWPVSIDAVAR